MGGLIVTFLFLGPVLFVTGLICFPKFADFVGFPEVPRLANALKSRLLGRLAAFLNSQDRSNADFIGEEGQSSHTFKSVVNRLLKGNAGQTDSGDYPGGSCVADMSALNCRVRLGRIVKDGFGIDTFIVEICGTIHAPDDKEEAVLKVTMSDVTGSEDSSDPVLSRGDKWRAEDSDEFCYSCDLGRMTGRETVLSNWTNVAKLQADWFLLPKRGARDLRLRASIVSRGSCNELASACCTFAYDNDEFGYMDFDENRHRSRTLAVALAFTVSASEGKMFNSQVDLIKDWARANVCSPESSDQSRRELEDALEKTFAFFRDGHKLNTFQIAKELVEIASLGERSDIMGLCLNVVKAKGSASSEEVEFLGELACWLELDSDHYREMAEKVLPVNIHDVKDTWALLGVTPGMSAETTRKHLNREYIKWNARVTNSDPEIRAQADEMLGLIAEVRREYVG